MLQCMSHFPGRNQILERLMIEGIFDREELGLWNDAKEYALHHATAMCQRLLVRMEELEGVVSVSDWFVLSVGARLMLLPDVHG